MLRAAPEKPAVGKEGQPGFQPPLRVQLFHHDRIPGEKGQEGDIVLPAHFMAGCDGPATIADRDGQGLRLASLPGLHGLELLSAAVHIRIICGKKQVPAVRTEIKFQLVQISVAQANILFHNTL